MASPPPPGAAHVPWGQLHHGWKIGSDLALRVGSLASHQSEVFTFRTPFPLLFYSYLQQRVATANFLIGVNPIGGAHAQLCILTQAHILSRSS